MASAKVDSQLDVLEFRREELSLDGVVPRAVVCDRAGQIVVIGASDFVEPFSLLFLLLALVFGEKLVCEFRALLSFRVRLEVFAAFNRDVNLRLDHKELAVLIFAPLPVRVLDLELAVLLREDA